MDETVGLQMLKLLLKEGKQHSLSEDLLSGVQIAYDIMHDEGYFNLDDWEEMSYEEQLSEVKKYYQTVMKEHNKTSKKSVTGEKLSFDWIDFLEEDFQRLKKELHPDIYGHIVIDHGNKKYLVDVEWETKGTYDRDGFSLNVYEADESYCHGVWVDDLKCINDSKTYTRFVNRAQKAISECIKNWESA